MKTTSCGNFSEDGKEFILARPRLDRPWMNVLSNGNWCYVASHLGGGYSFLGNPTVGRITRWHVDGVPRDTVGKFVYLRDEETGRWWTANGYPPTRNLDQWRCHIGLGYNRIVSEHEGIGADIRYFCPMPDVTHGGDGTGTGDPCLIWTVRLANRSGRRRIVTATNYVELALGNWFEDTSWREFYLLFNRQEFQDNTLYTRSTQWVKYLGGWQAVNSDANNIPFEHAVFLASSAPVAGYEGDRYEFVGSYRDLADPQAMDTGVLRNQTALGRDACEALQHRFELAPDEEVEYVLLLGAVPAESTAAPLVARYGTPEKAAAALANHRAYWDRALATPRIETPDADLDRLANYWFKYQGANLSWWNRNTGYCYSGIYNFGVRDACQDAVSRLPQDSHWVREHIVQRIMIWQFEEGDYAHGGNFVNMQGTRTFHSDDPINPAFILANYVRETGDFSVLDEQTPYAHTDGRKTDTIYRHIIRGLDFFFTQFSARGLPLILKADWNDALDQMGNQRRGESVMLACWAVYCIEQFYACMEHVGDAQKLAEYRQRLDQLKRAVNGIAWDGRWYFRATHDSGWVLGSQSNQCGKIWSNPNSFAIVSGVADQQRRESILAAFDEYLDHELGSYTFYPPFAEPDPRCGIISRFAPGTKENGAIFGHSSRWRIWAECHAGRGDKAYEIFKKMSPTTRHEADPDLYRIEPYVACQFIYAPESGRPGEGSHSWATGTACWTLLNVWEHMFGVKPEVDGLRIDPCLPSAWTEARMTRMWRGATYEIHITKRAGICRGTVAIKLDGRPLQTNLVPPCGDGRSHQIEVTVT